MTGTPPETDLAPFELVPSEQGHSLVLTEFEPAVELFEARGLAGGGYAWETVARHVIATEAPDLEDKIRFDPDGSMFCAYADDDAVLAKLGSLLAGAFASTDRLRSLIEAIGVEAFED